MLDAADKIEPIYVAIGQRVLEERTRAGWTQNDLCCQVGLSRTSIANIELGRQRLMLHQILALADALSVPVDALMGVGVQSARDSDDKREMRAELVRLRRRNATLEGALMAIAQKATALTTES